MTANTHKFEGLGSRGMAEQESQPTLDFKLSVSDPIRLPNPEKLSRDNLRIIFDELNRFQSSELLKIRERTYEVLDRMDEILLEGGVIPAEHCDEIIRGLAILEEVIITKMNGKKLNTMIINELRDGE